MVGANLKRLLTCFLVVAVTGCGSGDFDDLKAYMAEVKSKPKGLIEPIPAFMPYKAFTYSATVVRSPFDKPVKIQEITRLGLAKTNVKPDEDRPREYLEKYNLESLQMVGTLTQSDQLWILIDDGEGGVHRVHQGNYLGRNHGKIVEVTSSYISVIEIVPDGSEGWVERPRTLKLKESE